MGLNRVAKYYYTPAWQEPTGFTEVVFNKAAYEALPATSRPCSTPPPPR